MKLCKKHVIHHYITFSKFYTNILLHEIVSEVVFTLGVEDAYGTVQHEMAGYCINVSDLIQ